jgi:hypothetical protein
MAILDERGLFWWHDELIPDRQFAPDSSIGGLLKIGKHGQITLELDLYFPSEHGPMSGIVNRGKPIERCIQGILKVTGKRVLLSDVSSNGSRFSSNGISYESYRAMECVVSDEPFPAAKEPPKYDNLEIRLDGFEEWLRSGPIDIATLGPTISINYKSPDDISYSCDGSELLVRSEPELHSSGMLGRYAASVRESTSFVLRFHQPMTLNDLRTQFGLMEDLLVVLTDSDYGLDWPWLSIKSGTRQRFYFARQTSTTSIEKPAYYNCPTNFRQIRDRFGSIWSEWKKKRERYGPGIYLYLGTRRGTKLYIEHRFANLVWGLEAFHRRGGLSTADQSTKETIDRIIGRITDLEDKKWLQSKLWNAHEPSLSTRLFDVLNRIPINLEEKRLQDFSETCAKRRNDISHFGGLRSGGSYSDFIRELNNLSEALSTLSHALLLFELGIEPAVIKHWVYDSFRAGQTKAYFHLVGLLDKRDLKSGKAQ